MDKVRAYGPGPFGIAVVHGGPGAPGEMAPVARELCTCAGILEPLQSASSIQGQVEELKDVLDRHAVLPVTLIGHSWGAWLCCILASRHPDVAKKLILVSSGPFEDSYAGSILQTRLSRLNASDKQDALLLMAKLETGKAVGREDIARFGDLVSKADSFESEDVVCTDELPFNPEVFRAVWNEADRLRRSGGLLSLARGITCPVVAIHGDHDPHPARGVSEPLSRALRDFRFVLLERCGHYPWRERFAKDEFYSILKEELGRRP